MLTAAASSDVNGGTSRVFTAPIRGAFAMTAIAQCHPECAVEEESSISYCLRMVLEFYAAGRR
jgi:hypothetical protein